MKNKHDSIHENRENYMVKDLQWFIDRIGKRVYRNTWTCQCPTCVDVARRWLIIANEMHASYLCDVEGTHAEEWIELNYRDEL